MRHDSRSCSPQGDPRQGFFEDLAGRWDRVGQDPGETVRQLAAHARLLGLQPGQDLLEVGCGTGQISGWLAEQIAPGRLVAVDFAAAMLDQARAKHAQIEFRQVDVCCDPLGQRAFDTILCFHSFPHFRDQAAALRNMAQALRDAGRLLVMHLAGSAQINAFHTQVGGVVGHDHLPCDGAWEPLLAGAGLAREEFIDREGLFLLAASKRPVR